MNKITQSLVLLACVGASTIANAALITGNIVNSSSDNTLTTTDKIEGFTLPPSVSPGGDHKQFTIDTSKAQGTYWFQYEDSNKDGCLIKVKVPGEYGDHDLTTIGIGNGYCYKQGNDIIIT